MLRVELVEHAPCAHYTGIGRYTRELYASLQGRVDVALRTGLDPPLATHLSFLHHLPLGVRGHEAGRLIHFTQILGCAQMLWRPTRPAVATIHDLGSLAWPPEAAMLSPLDRFFLHLSYQSLTRMDALIAVSEFSRQCAISRLRVPPGRIFTVHSGNNGRHFQPVAGARRRLEDRGVPDQQDQATLLYVGSELPRKNLVTLLETAHQLKQRGRRIRLLKIGSSGGERFRTVTREAVARLGLEKEVLWFDHVSDQELPVFYSAADVYVCPSFLEGFGHPVLEAMACGTPVVCARTGSLPEIAGDAAALVSPSRAVDFADAIETLLDDPNARCTAVARGLQRAATYTWDKTAEGTVAVYARVSRAVE